MAAGPRAGARLERRRGHCSHGPIPPSIFIVGDRKQSIYGFRDAEVAVLDEAARYIDALRPEAPARAAITRSFRSVRELLTFVNDVFDGDREGSRTAPTRSATPTTTRFR